MKVLLTIALAALLAAPAHAYDMTQLRQDMKAHYEKMKNDLGDVTMHQEATFEGKHSPMMSMKTTTYMKGLLWRSDAVMQGKNAAQQMNVTSLFDGTDMWSVVMGMKQKLPKGAIGGQGATGMWNEFPDDATIAGEETISGHPCWKVTYTAPKAPHGSPGGPVTVWVDKTMYMPIQMEFGGSKKPVRMVQSDFRKVKGYEFPWLTEMYKGDEKTMTIKVTKIDTGTRLSDDLFDASKLEGSEGMDMNAMMKKAMEMQKQQEAAGKKGGE